MEIQSLFYVFIGVFGVCVLISTAHIIKLTITRQPNRHGFDNRSKNDLYEDADGTATEASMKAFSDLMPRIFIILGTLIGIIASTLSAAVRTVEKADHSIIVPWVLVAQWV